jgi:RimJ/RimL family protein N-acetyltransferase
MKTIILENGQSLTIREAKEEDAQAIIEFIKAVGDESDNLTFSGSEFNETIEEEKVILRDHDEQENQIFIIAFINDEMVGQLHAHASKKSRLRHACELGISTRKHHWGKGIATELLTYLIEWAKGNPVIQKVNLRCNISNKKAIALYERMGFESEGCHKRDFFLHGEFQDTVSMGLIID